MRNKSIKRFESEYKPLISKNYRLSLIINSNSNHATQARIICQAN